MKLKVKRVTIGIYNVTDTVSGRYVVIQRNEELSGPQKWIAYAAWNSDIVTDPMWTKAECVRFAQIVHDDAHAVGEV